MEPYDVCTSCRRHVKRNERRCPICDAPHVAQRDPPPRTFARMSRGQWAALGSTLVLMSCSDATPQTVDAASLDVATSERVDVDNTSSADSAKPDISEVVDASDDPRPLDGSQLDTFADRSVDAHDETAADVLDVLADTFDPRGADASDVTSDAPGVDGSEDARDADRVDGSLADRTADTSEDVADACWVVDVAFDITADGIATPIPPPGRFFCGWCSSDAPCFACDGATEYCLSIDGSRFCRPFEPNDAGVMPNAACPIVATCECVLRAGWNPDWNCGCASNNGGVTCSRNGCYGAPPARPELPRRPTLRAVSCQAGRAR